MGLRALQTAATGMAANQFNLDVVANNLANAGTTAFKRSRTDFEDLYYEYLKIPGAQDAQGQLTPVGVHVGLGTQVSAVSDDHRQGSLQQTGRALDVAVVGDGFFQVQDGGQIVYTRAGNFSLNADGQLVIESANRGRLLEPAITIPTDATDINISSQGLVTARTAGSTAATQVGQLQLARFTNPQGLVRLGENLFSESDASGTAQIGNPGQDGLGSLRQNALEASNVEPVRELVDLIKTQRHFELNSQVIQAADQSLQLLANLRRF